MPVPDAVRTVTRKIEVIASNHRTQFRFLVSISILVAIGFWFVQISALEISTAVNGSSPLHWVYVSLDPEKSSIDWATGTRNLGKSMPMHLYRLSHEYLDADLFLIMKAYMAIETIAMLAAFYFFARVSAPASTRTFAVLFCLIVALTSVQSMNLARFGYPFVWGLYYSLASAFRILGFALVLRDRPWPAMAAFALGIVTHPLMGLIGLAAGGSVVLYRGFHAIKRFLIPGVVFGLLVVSWLWIGMQNDEIAGGGIPLYDWFMLTKTFNYHWYPFHAGVFAELAYRYWLPLLGLMLVYFFVYLCAPNHSNIERELNLVVAVLLLMTISGLVISYLELSPFLVKLSLHRSSDLLVVVTLLVVLKSFFADLGHQDLAKRILAATLLISPVLYWRLPGIPLLVALAYTATFYTHAGRLGQLRKYALVAIWIGSLVVYGYYLVNELGLFGESPGLSRQFESRAEILLSALLVISLLGWGLKRYAGVFSLIIISWLAVAIVTTNHDRVSRRLGAKSEAWHEVQIWARDNTPDTALFMLDPSHYGGWRDVSRRASYGSVREWLHNAWLYDSDPDLFREGVRRFEQLGLDLDDYYRIPDRRERFTAMIEDARRKYYGQHDAWFKEVSDREGIHYLVFERKYLRSDDPSFGKKSFENRFFVIFEVARNDQRL